MECNESRCRAWFERTCKKTDDREDNRMQNNYDFPKQRKLSLAPLYLFHSSASSSDLNVFFYESGKKEIMTFL